MVKAGENPFYHAFFSDLREIRKYIDYLTYEEWKEVTFQVLRWGLISQRNVMRKLGVNRDNDLLFKHAFELSQSLHELPIYLLEISSAGSYDELIEVYDVSKSFIDTSQEFLALTINRLYLLNRELGCEIPIIFKAEQLISLNNYINEVK